MNVTMPRRLSSITLTLCHCALMIVTCNPSHAETLACKALFQEWSGISGADLLGVETGSALMRPGGAIKKNLGFAEGRSAVVRVESAAVSTTGSTAGAVKYVSRVVIEYKDPKEGDPLSWRLAFFLRDRDIIAAIDALEAVNAALRNTANNARTNQEARDQNAWPVLVDQLIVDRCTVLVVDTSKGLFLGDSPELKPIRSPDDYRSMLIELVNELRETRNR